MYSGYYGESEEEYDPFSLLVGDGRLVRKRLKNPRVKSKKDRYRVWDDNWDPFQNLTLQST